MFISNASLIRIGVYPDPTTSPAEARVSSEFKSFDNGRCWSEAKEAYAFDISDKDSEMLAQEVTLPTIEFVL